ncbi:MAG: C40 family peptidase [Clostridia bacterium]|nr:C40 family peptidase [Clostridia bacterium]
MVFKKNPKQYLLSIIICISVAAPVIVLPIGINNGVNPKIAVRRAYASTFPDEEVQEEVQVEDWAIAPLEPVIVENNEVTSGVVYTEDGLIDISQGGVVQATYADGAGPVAEDFLPVSTRYSDVPTFTVVQCYDEANLPIELLDTQVFAPDETYYYIAASNSIIKETPDMSSITLSTIALGTGVTRIGIGDTWSKIRTESGTEGYVLTNTLSIEPVHVAIDRTVWVDCDGLTLRASNSVDSEVLATLPRDTRLHCTEIVDKWFKVTTPSGVEGYVYVSYTTTQAPPTPTPVPTKKPASSGGSSSSGGGGGTTGNVASLPTITGCNGESIKSICESMLGVKYVWAGESSTGVDCSGLVVYAYRQVGISVPHLAQSITTCGVGVARSDIAVGDVVCWDTGGGYCGHVGIYVGGGQVIHASNSRTNVCYGNVDMMPILTIRRFIQ